MPHLLGEQMHAANAAAIAASIALPPSRSTFYPTSAAIGSPTTEPEVSAVDEAATARRAATAVAVAAPVSFSTSRRVRGREDESSIRDLVTASARNRVRLTRRSQRRGDVAALGELGVTHKVPFKKFPSAQRSTTRRSARAAETSRPPACSGRTARSLRRHQSHCGISRRR